MVGDVANGEGAPSEGEIVKAKLQVIMIDMKEDVIIVGK